MPVEMLLLVFIFIGYLVTELALNSEKISAWCDKEIERVEHKYGIKTKYRKK